MWPLIARELRVSSRRWSTYWLRMLPPTAMTAVFLVWGDGLLYRGGGEIFASMHRAVLVAFWALTPLMAADCLSGERREGTLGLLFLTDLTAREIVVAKAFAHGLRATTLWLATAPLIGLPLLAGGLTWMEIGISCCISLSSIWFALGATVLASALARGQNSAVGLAVAFSVLAFFAHALLVIWLCALLVSGMGLSSLASSIGRGFHLDDALELLLNLHRGWNFGIAANIRISVAFAVANSLALIAVWIFLAAAAFAIRVSWKERVKTRGQEQIEKALFRPRYALTALSWLMRYMLERNPIAWLEIRSWTARMAALVWLAIMISFGTIMLTYAGFWDSSGAMMLDCSMLLLLITVAFVAAGSFQRERETGAMELILVTPLRELDLLLGRLKGLWMQFLPAVLVWALLRTYLGQVAFSLRLESGLEEAWSASTTLECVFAFVILPPIGLFFSLHTRFVLLAWGATLTTVFALPELFARLIYSSCNAAWNHVWTWTPDFSGRAWVVAGIQAALAVALAIRLHSKIVRRSFSYQAA